ncbi:MAG TPA: DUF2911 domain-containing protein [Chryseolinea sp.]|nr:DUF2911 domain-containing protein [Chryseolinea sp.]
MKKKIYIGLALLLVVLVAFVLYGVLIASKKSPKETTTFSDKGLDIKVVYGRPFKRGRLIFGEKKDEALLPYGVYWRLGANAATEITFSKNVNFAGEAVNAGSYRMYAVPGADSFEISLNSELGVSAAHNEPDYSKDVLKVKIPVEPAPETEQLTISFNGSSTAINMDIAWDKIKVRVPITLQ